MLSLFRSRVGNTDFSLSVVDTDLRTPAIETAIIAVTTTCNLRCTYCAVSLPDYRGETMDFSRMDKIAEEMSRANVRNVQISGHGETTAIPGWEEACEAFLSRDIGLLITSNFSKLFSDREITVLAKMRGMSISIDTVDRDLLAKLRRKVDLRTLLYNMQRIRLRAKELNLYPTFNWQCTLTVPVIGGLLDWVELGLMNGVNFFTLGNLIELDGLEEVPRHIATLDGDELLAACEMLARVSRRCEQAKVALIVQPGIVEGINAKLPDFRVAA